MKRIVKGCIIGGSIYALCDLSFHLGKGYILGLLTKYNVTSQRCMDLASNDKSIRAKVIYNTAKFVIRGEES